MRPAFVSWVSVYVVLAGVACSSPPPLRADDPDVRYLSQRLDELRGAARQLEPARAATLLRAVTTLGPTPGVACPIAVPVMPVDDGTPAPVVDDDRDLGWRTIRERQMMVVPEAELGTTPGRRFERIETRLEELRERMFRPRPGDPNHHAAIEAALQRVAERAPGWELVVVTSTYEAPQLLADAPPKPGSLVGRAYLYDYPTNSVVCVGDVAAHSSGQLVANSPWTAEQLAQDLENEAYRAAARNLSAAGPKRPEPAAEPPRVAAADAAPAEKPTVERARKALAELLMSLFNDDELRRHIAYGPEGDALRALLPGPTASLVTLTDAVVLECEKRGQIGDAFFARLISERPRRADDIEPVARLWRELPR